MTEWNDPMREVPRSRYGLFSTRRSDASSPRTARCPQPARSEARAAVSGDWRGLAVPHMHHHHRTAGGSGRPSVDAFVAGLLDGGAEAATARAATWRCAGSPEG